MANGDLFGPDKDTLRTLLPIREVARQLVSKHGCAGPHILADGTALCPFHADTNESFYLWDGDDGVERFWCQPCGFGGDIFDLIRRSLNVSFPASVEEAQRMWAAMPPGYVAPAVQKKYTPSMDTWRNSVDVARNYAAREDRQGIFAVALGLVPNDLEHAQKAHEWDRFLRDTWRWGITPPEGHADAAGVLRGNLILMPHYDTKDELTGCKTRSGPQKGSLPGSKYVGLYGEWLGRRYRDVLLTEGESDAAYGAYTAARERIPIDVFALPSGAGKPPLVEHADFLRGARTIYLAFDPDEAGIRTTREWIEFLAGQGFPDIRVCSLPWGRDLRSARPVLADLLAKAKTPLPAPGDVLERPEKQGWDRLDTQGNRRQVTSWVIEPLAKLAGGDEPGLDVLLHSRRASVKTTIRWADMEGTRTFNKWANRHDMNFTGSDADRKAIVLHVEADASILPQIFQTEQVGAQPAPEDYAFAGESMVYPNAYLGKMPWRYTPYNKSAADVSDRILLPLPEDTIPFEWSWLDSFLRLSDPSVTNPILAWVVAASRRHTVKNFPLLYVGGSSGVGKSTLARLAMKLGGSAIEVNLGAVTPFVLTKTLAATTNIPVFVDEWTLLSRQDTLEQFQGAIPLLYTGERAERGQADLSMVTYRMTAPTIIAGEQELQLDREIDRMVAVFPSRSSQNTDALASIEHAPLEGFAWALHNYLLSGADLTPLDYAPAASRPIYNQQVLLAGWRILQDFLFSAQMGGEEVPDLPAVPDLSCFERAAEDRLGANIYEVALSAGVPMRDKNGVPVVWADEEGRGTWVRVRELIGEIKSRRLDLKLPGGERAMLRYFEERHTVAKSRDIRPTGASTYVRAALIEDLHVTPQQEGIVA